ncbi:hypothetical protein [Pseudoalteromonas xiamenensis]
MTDKYRVIYTGLDSGIEQEVAITRLATKLGLPENKAAAFFAKKPLFAPADKEKAMKQVKLFASMGIQAKLQTSGATNDSSSAQRDERLFEALDYITSSLIRLEERLEEIEQRLGQTPAIKHSVDDEEDWEDDGFLDDLDIDPQPKKRSPIVLYSLVSGVAILVILLALTLIHPDIMNF